MPVKHILSIEVQLPGDYPWEPLSKDIASNLMRKVAHLCEQQAKRIGMCQVESDFETTPTFRLVVEEQCAQVMVTRSQEIICLWAGAQLLGFDQTHVVPRVKDSLLMVPLRWPDQTKLFLTLINSYAEAVNRPDFERAAKTLAGKIETELGPTAN
jgi:hypothetical protein